MRILKIKTKTGIKTVYDVTDWGWSAETGDLYYRTEKGLHHKYCIAGVKAYGLKGMRKRGRPKKENSDECTREDSGRD